MVGKASGTYHQIEKPVAEGLPVFHARSASTGQMSIEIRAVATEAYNTAPAAAAFGRNSSNGRSICAGGTINGSGADYAEYMVKADGCGLIAKGDVCGVDRDGRLTKTWADAISFVVKSTDPSLVGGDTWSAQLPPRPEAPGAEPIAPVMPTSPDPDEPASKTYALAMTQYVKDSETYLAAGTRWKEEVAAYDRDLSAWEADLEAARQCVDRIAFCGQVPCNVTGDFEVGDYIVAAANGRGSRPSP